MPNEQNQAIDDDQFATIISYLANGGTLAEANQISPNALEATYEMAYNQYTSGHYEEAAKAFQYLCVYDQWNPKHFYSLGACQQMLHQYGQAIKTYILTFRLDPLNPLPLVYMADCSLALNDVDQAIKTYKTAIEHAKDVEFTHEELNRAKSTLATVDINDRDREVREDN